MRLPRLAVTLAYRDRHHLFHQEQVARLLTFYDRWLLVLGPFGDTLPDDGTEAILRSLAARYPDRLLIEESSVPWRNPVDALQAALLRLRPELHELGGAAYLWRVDLDEIWELSALQAAERELQERGLDSGEFHAQTYVGPELIVVGEWGNRQRHRRLWHWCGQLATHHGEGLLCGGDGRVGTLTPTFERHVLTFAEDATRLTLQHQHLALLQRWHKLQHLERDKFPLPLAELFGPAGQGLTDSQILHL